MVTVMWLTKMCVLVFILITTVHGAGYYYSKASGFSHYPVMPTLQPITTHPTGNPGLLMALLLNALLEPSTSKVGTNHPDHGPVNPYVALILSQYGRYLPAHALGTNGLYYYAASNNYHNNKPFGSYKVYENAR